MNERTSNNVEQNHYNHHVERENIVSLHTPQFGGKGSTLNMMGLHGMGSITSHSLPLFIFQYKQWRFFLPIYTFSLHNILKVYYFAIYFSKYMSFEFFLKSQNLAPRDLPSNVGFNLF